MAKHSQDILALARRGAQARYDELVNELEYLAKQFPGLRSGAREVVRRGRNAVAAAVVELAPKKKRKRSKMSAAQKAEVSARMKKYWAERRQAKGAKKR